MYTQGLDQHGNSAVPGDEDPAASQRFQARIDAEEKIEPKDWMPAAYRKTLVRQISQHAHDLGVGVLRDLTDQSPAVGVRHPVLRLDLLFAVHPRLKAGLELFQRRHAPS